MKVLFKKKICLIFFSLIFSNLLTMVSCGNDVAVKFHLVWPQSDSSYQYKISDVETIQVSFWQETKEENPLYKIKKVEELNFGRNAPISAKINKGTYDIFIKGLVSSDMKKPANLRHEK